jgi:pyruvate dehydrogenase E2 component (dihydrolipoamide acetyltransferase)
VTTFALPDLGEGLTEAEIVAWHVAPGDRVVADQPLVAVETDKAVVEIPAPWSGRITRLHGEPGERVEAGAPLVEYEEAVSADAGTVVGALPSSAETAPAPAPTTGRRAAARATPAVRALARSLGVDLAAVAPGGPDGSITRADVERAARALGAAGPAEPLRGVRRSMAEAMTRAGDQIVPATLTDEADVHAWPPGTDATVRLVRALAAACRAEPALNAWYEPEPPARRVHRALDLAIAVDTEEGLFAPVLRDVGAADPAELRPRLDALVEAVRTRTLAPADVRAATFTLSNFGTLGGRHAALVVVPPQVAILGAGRIAPRAVAAAGGVEARRTLPLSLTFDHRAVTGGEAARFLAAVIADLEPEG